MAGPEDTLYDVFSKTQLSVPEYQRGYSWDEQNIEDLTDDLTYLLDEHLTYDKQTEHYFGTVIFETDANSQFNIVDGQQRLISISLLVDSICKSTYINRTDLDAENLKERYVGSRDEPAIRTKQQGREIYERLVFEQVSPQSLTAEIPSETNLIQAKDHLDAWVSKVVEDYEQSPEEVLKTLCEIIDDDITLTIHEVDNSSEAGRIFETINDRGKDLTIADKIKSYLIYVADRRNEQALGQQVFETFGKIIQRISAVSTTNRQQKVESFLKEHWRVFTGEARFDRSNSYPYTEIHRKLKKQKEYASLSRDTSELIGWIEAYLQSLKDCLDSYCLFLAPRKEIEGVSTRTRKQIIERVEQLGYVVQDSNIVALFIAVHRRFGTNQRLIHVLELLEKFGFRAFEVCRANRDARRTRFREAAYQLYYAGRSSAAREISPNGRKSPYSDIQSGYRSVCYVIENAIGAYAAEQSFEKNLRRDDVINGSLNDGGWNGFRVKESILYFLVEYNSSLSERKPTQYELSDIADSTIQREHIWPRDIEMVEPRSVFEHRRKRDSIGNLAFLPADLPTDPSGKSYTEKYRRFYTQANSPTVVRQLPDPTESPTRSEEVWGPDQIDERRERMVQFAKKRWEVETRAYIHLIETPSGDTQQIESEIRTTVRDRFDGSGSEIPSEFNNLPRVDIGGSKPDFNPDLTNACPRCGSTAMRINSRSSTGDSGSIELEFECECGEQLTRPSVSFYLADHN